MLRKLFLILLAAPVLVLAAGCCGNTPCDCRDSLADSLYFAFDNTFTPTELDTVYVARYSNASPTHATDSLPLLRHTRVPSGLSVQVNFAGQDTTGLLVISNNAPFSQSGSNTNLSRYTYRLYLLRDGSRTTYYRYTVDNIGLIGTYQADGCCTCYRNSQKLVRVQAVAANGSPTATLVNGNLTDENNNSAPRIPKVIHLTK